MNAPTAVGIAALAPQPMTAEQIADLVRRVREQPTMVRDTNGRFASYQKVPRR